MTFLMLLNFYTMLETHPTLTHFKNLVVVAMADNQLDEYEKRFLLEKAVLMNIDSNIVDELITNVNQLEFNVPNTIEGKEDQLSEIISMALADGVMHPYEKKLCKQFTYKLGLSDDDLEQSITFLKKALMKNVKSSNALSKFTNLVLVAHADNNLEHEEIKYLIQKAKQLENPYMDANRLIMEVENLEFIVPETLEEKEEQLADIVELSLVDGQLHEEEHELCFKIAQRIGFNKQQLEQAILLAKRMNRVKKRAA